MVSALSDYSMDQRGDVGSWIRIVALKSSSKIVAFAVQYDQTLISQGDFDNLMYGILKQAVEKLEPVREAAALALWELRLVEADRVWQWEQPGAVLFNPGAHQ